MLDTVVLDPFCGTATTMVAALKHGRNSIGVECPSPHPMGRGTKGEVFQLILKQAASRLMNENSSLFGQARFQIELKPHAAVESVAVIAESATPYRTRVQKKPSRKRRSSVDYED